MRVCVVCEDDFDPNSPAKRRAGGRVNTCPDCSEDVPRYLGLQAGDGKMSSITVLAFHSQNDRELYKKYWRANSGMNVGKSCQLSSSNPATPGVSFKTITQSQATNHKGKL